MPLPDNIQDLIRQYSKDDDAYHQLLAIFEDQLSEQTADYRQRFDNHDAIQILIEAGSGKLLDANRAAATFYGYSVEQLCTMRIRDLNILSSEDASKEIEFADFQQRPYYEFRHRLASGEVRDVHVFSSPVRTTQGLFYHSIVVDVTGQREVELRYQSLFEQSTDAVYIMSLEGKFIQVNERAAEALGYTMEEFKTISPHDTIAPQEHEIRDNVLERLLGGEQVPPYERTYRRKDNTTFPGEINAQLIRDTNGQPVYIQAIVRDISRRKEMEQATQSFLEDMKALQDIHLELSSVRPLSALYRRMIELAHERLGMERIALFRLDETGEHLLGTYGTDIDGNVRNEGYFRDKIHESHWTLTIHNAPNHTHVWLDDDLYEDHRIVGKGWKIASTLWSGMRSLGYLICDNLISGRPPRPYETELISLLASTFGHLIERLEAEETLYDLTISMQEMVTAGNTGLWSWDLEANEVQYDAMWKKQIGYEEFEFEEDHENFLAHVHPDDVPKLEKAIEKAITQKLKNQSVEFRLQHKDGSYRWILSQGSVYTDDQGQPVRMRGTHVEITKQKEIQEREFEYALEKERLRLLTDFIQDAAHEFRTPLSTINSNVYLMKASANDDYRERKAEQIEIQVGRIKRLVDMLLMMARLEGGHGLVFSSVDVTSIITALCNKMQSKYHGIPKLTMTIEDDLPTIIGDVNYLTEAFNQLLENAYHYTSDDGEIIVSAKVEDNQLRIEINDTGVGIPEESIKHIFETFWRHDIAHSTPGFGLGLPITKNIIDYHRGKIEVKSTLGEGTRFCITLPII